MSEPLLRADLEIRAYHCRVHLGCSDEERAFAQEVRFDVRIRFPGSGPLALLTDRLEDTLCYDRLCARIEAVARSKPFHLIESLSREVYEALKDFVRSSGSSSSSGPSGSSNDSLVEVSVHKLHTPVANLRGGACFVYGDRLS